MDQGSPLTDREGKEQSETHSKSNQYNNNNNTIITVQYFTKRKGSTKFYQLIKYLNIY